MPDINAVWFVVFVCASLALSLAQAFANLWTLQRHSRSEHRLVLHVQKEKNAREIAERALGQCMVERDRLKQELREVRGGAYAVYSLTTAEDFDDDSTQDATVTISFDDTSLTLERVDRLADEIICGEHSATRQTECAGADSRPF